MCLSFIFFNCSMYVEYPSCLTHLHCKSSINFSLCCNFYIPSNTSPSPIPPTISCFFILIFFQMTTPVVRVCHIPLSLGNMCIKI